MNEPAAYVLINGVVYKYVRAFTRRGTDEYYLRVSVPAAAARAARRYPAGKLPKHEVITDELATQIRVESLAACRREEAGHV